MKSEQTTVRDCRLCSTAVGSDRLLRHVNAYHQTDPKLFCSRCKFASSYSSKEVDRHIDRSHPNDNDARVIDRRLFFEERCAVVFDRCFADTQERPANEPVVVAEGVVDKRNVTPPVTVGCKTMAADRCEIIDGETGRPVKKPKRETTQVTPSKKTPVKKKQPPMRQINSELKRPKQEASTLEHEEYIDVIGDVHSPSAKKVRRSSAPTSFVQKTKSAGKQCPECNMRMVAPKKHFYKHHLAEISSVFCPYCPFASKYDLHVVQNHINTHHGGDNCKAIVDERPTYEDIYIEWRKDFHLQ